MAIAERARRRRTAEVINGGPYTRLMALQLISEGRATTADAIESTLNTSLKPLSSQELTDGIRVYLNSMVRLGCLANIDGELTLTELGKGFVKDNGLPTKLKEAYDTMLPPLEIAP